MPVASAATCCFPTGCFWWREATPKAAARIAYLNTEDAPKWEDQLDIFASSMSIPASCLERFDCYKGEFPSRHDLETRFDSVLITGSHFSAIDPELKWLPGLFACIRNCADLPSLGVVACCFGAQACAVALGGEVGKNPDGKFVFGAMRLQLAQAELAKHCWVQQALDFAGNVPSSIDILESHGEQILQLPSGASLLAWSDGTPHELFLCGKHSNILCCQAHPEFDRAIVMDRIAPALRSKGRFTDEELAELDGVMASRADQGNLLCTAYRNFLVKRRIPAAS